MKPLALARRYARALADVAGAKDRARLEKLAAEIDLVADVFRKVPRALRFLDDPSVRTQDKVAAIDTLAREARASDLTRRFLRVLIEHRRLTVLPEIARAFTEIKDERLAIVRAEATTAVPLSAAELKRLRESLETMTGRTVRLTTNVDPSVLGGARTRIGSRVYDGTLSRQLALLRARLAVAR